MKYADQLRTLDFGPTIDDITILALQLDHDYCEPKVIHTMSIIYILIYDIIYTLGYTIILILYITYTFIIVYALIIFYYNVNIFS